MKYEIEIELQRVQREQLQDHERSRFKALDNLSLKGETNRHCDSVSS